MPKGLDWFRFYVAVLNCAKVQQLSDRQFRKSFYAAFNGEVNEFSPFMRFGRAASAAWREVREYVFLRDDFTCQYCDKRGVRLECDHVHPVCRGGTDDPNNLVTACWKCNRSKGRKTLEEWVRR